MNIYVWTTTELPKYYVWLQTAVTHGLGWSASRLVGCVLMLLPNITLLFQFRFRVDGHAHQRTFANGNVSVYWLWLLLDVSAVIVVIVIYDMSRQEFSLCERGYIHNMYMKSRESCSEIRRKFRVKFPGRPMPNPSIIRRQAKRFKATAL